GAAAAGPLLVALALDLADLLLEVLQTSPDAPPLDLDLLLAGAAAGADAAALAVVVPGPDQPRQEVMELRRLDLETTLVGACVLGEDVEYQLGSIDHPRLELLLQVALLAWAQIL